jgi:hypothetical protein
MVGGCWRAHRRACSSARGEHPPLRPSFAREAADARSIPGGRRRGSGDCGDATPSEAAAHLLRSAEPTLHPNCRKPLRRATPEANPAGQSSACCQRFIAGHSPWGLKNSPARSDSLELRRDRVNEPPRTSEGGLVQGARSPARTDPTVPSRRVGVFGGTVPVTTRVRASTGFGLRLPLHVRDAAREM